MKFKEVVQRYASDHNPGWKKLARRSKEIYLNGLRYLHRFDDIEVRKITRPMVIQLRDDMYDMSGMCRVALTCLSNVLGYAHDRGWVEYNQALNIKGLPSPKGIVRWSDDEIALFMDTAPKELRYAVALALYTGQRRSDLVRMRWPDYDGDFIKVRQQKTNRYLEIPVHKRLKVVLDEIERPTGKIDYILLNSHREPWQADWLRERIKRHCRAIGIKDRSIHGLRKSAASKLAEAGCTIHQIQAITGHTSVKEIENYTRAVDQRRLAQEAMEKWI